MVTTVGSLGMATESLRQLVGSSSSGCRTVCLPQRSHVNVRLMTVVTVNYPPTRLVPRLAPG